MQNLARRPGTISDVIFTMVQKPFIVFVAEVRASEESQKLQRRKRGGFLTSQQTPDPASAASIACFRTIGYGWIDCPPCRFVFLFGL
jgi:hypothetical protein